MAEKNNVSLVIFGGTGDLTRRKLIPAISGLVNSGILNKNSPIIGIGRSKFSDYEYKQFLIGSTSRDEEKRNLNDLDIRYACYGQDQKNPLSRLSNLLNEIDNKNECERIFYLATSSKSYLQILGEIKDNCLNKNNEFNKIVFEKPLGFNLESASLIEKKCSEIFNKNNIYIMDHYLGKEVIQNILLLKFTNAFFESTLNNKFVDSIDLTIDEDLGVANRIDYYNEIGAIKDIIQNHLLQTVALVLMDNPVKFDPTSIHNEKLKVLKSLEVLPSNFHLFGQYESYRKESRNYGIENSRTDTYARLVVNCKNSRWDGVRITMKTGKKLERKYASININYKLPEIEHKIEGITNNKIIIQLQPK